MIFAVIGVIAIGVFIVIGITAKRVQNETYNYKPVKWDFLGVEEKIFVQLVNDHRKDLGLPALIPEKLACEVCYNQTVADILNNEDASHEHWDRMRREAKVNYDNCSHICANQYSTGQGLFNGYMGSKEGHKEALEHPTRTHIGLSFMQYKNHCLITKYE